MHSIIDFCLCILFLAIECTEASDREAEEKIRFVMEHDSKIVKINDNLKTINDLSAKLVRTIGSLYFSLGSIIDKHTNGKKLSISISETDDESSIDTNEKNYSDYKLSDIVNEVKERSLANILGSFHQKWKEIENCFFGDDGILPFLFKDNKDQDELFLSKNGLSNLVDVCKVVEIISWYLYVQWTDTPSNADDNERENNLATIAQIDMEWMKIWDDLLSEIHRLSNDTSSGYDGAVHLSRNIFNELHDELLGLYECLLYFRFKTNHKTTIVTTNSKIDNKNYTNIFCILESVCIDNRYANASVQLEVKKSSSNSTAGTTSTEDVTNSANPDDAQKNENKNEKDMS